MIVNYTILLGHLEKPDTSFEIAIETLSFSWACYWLAGIISFQTKKFGETTPDTFVQGTWCLKVLTPTHKSWSPPLWLDHLSPLPIWQLRHGTIHSLLLPPVRSDRPPRQAIYLHPRWTYSTPLPKHTNKHLLNCTFSKSLTHN